MHKHGVHLATECWWIICASHSNPGTFGSRQSCSLLRASKAENSAALYGSVQRQCVEFCKKEVRQHCAGSYNICSYQKCHEEVVVVYVFHICSRSLMICGPVLTRLLFQTELEFAILETVGAHRLQSSRCIEGMYIIGYIPKKSVYKVYIPKDGFNKSTWVIMCIHV
jgi:hypothetical protein